MKEERQKIKNPLKNEVIFPGDIVSITKIHPCPVIKGAVYSLKNGIIHVLGIHSHKFNSEENTYFALDRHENGIRFEDIRKRTVIQRAEQAIPQMTGIRAFKKDEMVYLQDGKIKCIVGFVKAAYNNIMAIETTDEKLLMGSSRLWNRLQTISPVPEMFQTGMSAWCSLENDEYVWGTILGFALEKNNLKMIVQGDKNTCSINNVSKWELYN